MSDMFGKTVYEEEIGPLSYQIKRLSRNKFTLWLGGCRIGTPRDNGDIWEFSATTLTGAKKEMRASARRELWRRITSLEDDLRNLRATYERLTS